MTDWMAPGSAVHLTLLRPWRQAVDCFFPGDDDPDIDDLVFQTPQEFAAGDVMVFVVDAPTPVVIKVEVLSGGPADDSFSEPESEWGPFFGGLSLPAIERRLGGGLPLAPATITDSDTAQHLMAAIEGEEAEPTSWRELDNRFCRQADPGELGLPDCVGCGRDFTSTGSAEIHHLADHEDAAFADSSSVRVCSDCHDRLHRPLPESLADIVFERRPLCPVCSASRTLEVIWGMPAGPPGPGVALAGCVITGPTLEYRCGDCGYEWSNKDANYPAARDAKSSDRVRARLAKRQLSDFDPSRRHEPDRVVVGRYHPHDIGGASGARTRHLVIGEDRNHYIIKPSTLRRPDPAL